MRPQHWLVWPRDLVGTLLALLPVHLGLCLPKLSQHSQLHELLLNTALHRFNVAGCNGSNWALKPLVLFSAFIVWILLIWRWQEARIAKQHSCCAAYGAGTKCLGLWFQRLVGEAKVAFHYVHTGW